MTSIVKRYWKWDEKLNNTPYRLGSDIDDLLQKGFVRPDNDTINSYLGHAQGAPKYVEVSAGKVTLVWFSFPNKSYFPEIKNGLWDMEEHEFTTTLNDLLGLPCEPEYGDYLYVVFRGGFVTAAAILRRFPPVHKLVP